MLATGDERCEEVSFVDLGNCVAERGRDNRVNADQSANHRVAFLTVLAPQIVGVAGGGCGYHRQF